MSTTATATTSADPRVARYRETERTLWNRYGLQPTERFVDVSAARARLRVVEVGSGRPLLSVPGTAGTGPYWGALVRELRGFRCHIGGVPPDEIASATLRFGSSAARGYGFPMALHLFAGIRVRSFRAALPWYERLLGESSFLPHDTEAVWTLAEDRSIFIVEDVDPGRADITVFVDDLDATVAEIAARGLEPAERQTYNNGVRKALFRDVDGNEIGFGGAPRADEPG